LVALRIFEAEIERHLVVERERPDRHPGHAGEVLDHRGGTPSRT
jgi:hypothetical protein